MKRFFLILTLAIAVTMTANADDYEYLTVQKSDGTAVSFLSLGLTITFSGGNMVVTQNGTSTPLALSSLSKMFFSNSDVSGIQIATQKNATVEVFDLQGRRIAAQMRMADVNTQLPKGVYIVKKGDASVKVTVK